MTEVQVYGPAFQPLNEGENDESRCESNSHGLPWKGNAGDSMVCMNVGVQVCMRGCSRKGEGTKQDG